MRTVLTVMRSTIEHGPPALANTCCKLLELLAHNQRLSLNVPHHKVPDNIFLRLVQPLAQVALIKLLLDYASLVHVPAVHPPINKCSREWVVVWDSWT